MDNETLRRYVYALLIAVAAGMSTARIIGVERVYEPSTPNPAVWPPERPEKMPTFSSNDRSRWATIRSLVENGTYAIGERVKDPTTTTGYRDKGIVFNDGYKTIDVIKNPETDMFYSSKPPLFSTMVAGEYWLLKNGLGWTLADPTFRWPVICTILITVNVLPLIIFLLLLANLLEEYGTTDWGQLFVFTAACFGTFLTTFAVTLNNHTPAACCVMLAVYPLLRGRSIDTSTPISPGEALQSGFFGGLAAAFDLPAAAFAGVLLLVVFGRSPKRLFLFLPAALLPAVALMWTNFMAIGEWQLAYDKFGGPWYEYEGSHWAKAKINPNQKGIDFAREPKEIYAMHMLVGHHGLFSLTPIWFLALFGMFRRGISGTTRVLHLSTMLLTVVVIGFYIYKSNNYGGWTSGPRWQFWLTPLFLLTMIPVVDSLGRDRSGRIIAWLLLAVAVFSATYPVWNPWRHPWPYVLCEYMNWVKY